MSYLSSLLDLLCLHLTCQARQPSDVVSEWSLGKSLIQFLHIESEIQELKNAQR